MRRWALRGLLGACFAALSSCGGSPPPPPPTLAAAPVQLRRPGGTQKVAQALEHRGLLRGAKGRSAPEEELAAAILEFQKTHGLAATGFADQKTLQMLHLDPRQIDRAR